MGFSLGKHNIDLKLSKQAITVFVSLIAYYLPGTPGTDVQCDLGLWFSSMCTSGLVKFAPRRNHTSYSFHS